MVFHRHGTIIVGRNPNGNLKCSRLYCNGNCAENRLFSKQTFLRSPSDILRFTPFHRGRYTLCRRVPIPRQYFPLNYYVTAASVPVTGQITTITMIIIIIMILVIMTKAPVTGRDSNYVSSSPLDKSQATAKTHDIGAGE